MEILNCPEDPLCLHACAPDPISKNSQIPLERVIRLRLNDGKLICYDLVELYEWLRHHNGEVVSQHPFTQDQLDVITARYRALGHPEAPPLSEDTRAYDDDSSDAYDADEIFRDDDEVDEKGEVKIRDIDEEVLVDRGWAYWPSMHVFRNRWPRYSDLLANPLLRHHISLDFIEFDEEDILEIKYDLSRISFSGLQLELRIWPDPLILADFLEAFHYLEQLQLTLHGPLGDLEPLLSVLPPHVRSIAITLDEAMPWTPRMTSALLRRRFRAPELDLRGPYMTEDVENDLQEQLALL